MQKYANGWTVEEQSEFKGPWQRLFIADSFSCHKLATQEVLDRK